MDAQYGDTNLEDLAARYVAIDRLVVARNWPEDDMNNLIAAQNNLRDEIVKAPTLTGSDRRAKLHFVLAYVAEPTQREISDDVFEVASGLLADFEAGRLSA